MSAAPGPPSARVRIRFAAGFALTTAAGSAVAHFVTQASVSEDTFPYETFGSFLWMVIQWGVIPGAGIAAAQTPLLRRWAVARFDEGAFGDPGPAARRQLLRNTLWWPVATMPGLAAGFAISACILWPAYGGMFYWGNPGGIALDGFISGLALGIIQCLVLRPRARRAGGWIAATAAGLTIGNLAFFLTTADPTSALPTWLKVTKGGALLGLALGAAQGTCLVLLPPRRPPAPATDSPPGE